MKSAPGVKFNIKLYIKSSYKLTREYRTVFVDFNTISSKSSMQVVRKKIASVRDSRRILKEMYKCNCIK